MAKQVAEDVKKHVQRRQKPSNKIPQDLLAQYVASTFILVLNWWVESRNPLPPKEADALFRVLVMPTLTAAFP